MRQLTKAEQCRVLMYKRSAVARLNYSEICNSLYDMTSMCCDIKYAEQDDDTLINAFDGNEDEAHEFILQFSDLEYDIENLQNQFDEMFGYSDDPERDFNDVTVALIGKWFSLLGFDEYREDYFELDSEYFEEAIFILKPNKNLKEKGLLKECEDIINKNSFGKSLKLKVKKSIFLKVTSIVIILLLVLVSGLLLMNLL